MPPEVTRMRLLVVDDEEAKLVLLRGTLTRGELAGDGPLGQEG